jgi:heme-degrading monooxygenase HmoA
MASDAVVDAAGVGHAGSGASCAIAGDVGPRTLFRNKTMIAVIFEVSPADGRKTDYLDWAARLRPDLEAMDGFISIERFQSLADPGKILSLSIWRDEAAVAAWRRHDRHRAAQEGGRSGIFRDYRLRVAAVVRDYGMTTNREQAPGDSQERYDGR